MEATVLYRWYDEVWNKGDVTGISRMMHPKAVLNGLPVKDKGHAGFLNFYHGFRAEYSHVHVQVTEIFIKDDKEVAHCIVTARHIATTGKISFSGVTIARIQKDQIAEAWNYFDFQDLGKQVDALKLKLAGITGEVPYGN